MEEKSQANYSWKDGWKMEYGLGEGCNGFREEIVVISQQGLVKRL